MSLAYDFVRAVLIGFIAAAVMYVLGLLVAPAFAVTGLSSQEFASILAGVVGIGTVYILAIKEEQPKQ